MRVAIDTHGCRLNRFESDAMADALRRAGHTIVEHAAQADAYVLNSCTVTHQADADARRAVRRAQRERPGLRVIVTGCFANAEPQLAAALPGVDAVLGNEHKHALADVLQGLSSTPVPTLVSVDALARRRAFTPLPPAVTPARSRALLKVQDGCNYRCAFCIVPQVRGGSRSLDVATVVDQARTMVAAGVPELVLTGVHLGTYGRDLRPRRRLTDLVRALLPHLGHSRLRLSSIDPHEVDDELLGLVAAHSGTICRHLHLPVQSADDGVLRRMHRGHTVATFAALVRRAVERVPGIAIGSDVIVGFPGEDEAAFERTEARLAALPLAYLHVFPFSPRRGTEAASMPDPVAPDERARRGIVLRARSEAMEAARRRRAAGRLADVVVHRRPRRDGTLEALTDDYLRVALGPDAAAWAGHRVTVRVGPDGRHATIVPPATVRSSPGARAHGG